MRISDWSSDVCSSDLPGRRRLRPQELRGHDRRAEGLYRRQVAGRILQALCRKQQEGVRRRRRADLEDQRTRRQADERQLRADLEPRVGHHFEDEGSLRAFRSEEQTSELQSLMRISYAVFCLKKKKNH